MAGLDKEGFAVGDDGARIKDAEDNEIQIDGAKTQEDIDRVAAGLKKEIKTLRESKKELEAKGAKVDELELLIAQKEQEVDDAVSAAAAKVGEEMDGLKTENQQLKSKAQKKEIDNAILANAAEFIKPRYLQNEISAAGFIDDEGAVKFRVMIEEDGKQIEKTLSAKDAAAHVADNNPALVKSEKEGGAGSGGGSGEGTQNRSKMSRAEKTAYVGKHGAAAFGKLPQ